MQRLNQTKQQLARRKARIRTKVVGNASRPRLSVYISNQHVSAQLIDDEKQTTLASSTSATNKKISGTLTERAAWVGEDIAKRAAAVKVKRVVFDRNGRLYHGRIKALADAARENGLEF